MRNVIKKDDSSFIMRATMPDEWVDGATATINIKTIAGTSIIAAGVVTSGDSVVIQAAVLAGDNEVTVPSGSSFVAGEIVHIGSDAGGWRSYIVDDFFDPETSAATVYTTEALEESVAAGDKVVSRSLSYTVDASAAGFDNIEEVQVQWLSDGDGLTMSQLWQIESKTSQASGLEQKFAEAYKTVHSAMKGDAFAVWSNRALLQLQLYFESKLRNFDLIVDNPLIEEPWITQIALLWYKAGDEGSEAEYLRLKTDLQEQLDMLGALPIWIDNNDNDVLDEGETEPELPIGLGRSLV